MWCPICGYEGLYNVSTRGRVKSLERTKICGRGGVQVVRERILRYGGAGYGIVGLCKGGKVTYKTVHRLVAEAFIPNPESKPQVNHKDGNKQNNRVDNLEWSTGSENIRHADKTGLRQVCRGDKVWCAKLTNEAVSRIKHRLRHGDKQRQIATDEGASELDDARKRITELEDKIMELEFKGMMKDE